jgi:hypothetical protein
MPSPNRAIAPPDQRHREFVSTPYVAVMRKLLHAIYGMFTTNTDFVAEKFYAVAAENA